MKKLSFLLILLCITATIQSQNNLKELLKKYNQETIPYISVDSLQQISNEVVLLDAREKNEFNTSHIKNAAFVGYTNFNLKKTIKTLPDKNTTIVVYCSLGVRSEDIAEQLKNAGYKNVLNLYGGIFEWKNNHHKVVNTKGKETEKIHTCTKEWSKWLTSGKKVY